MIRIEPPERGQDKHGSGAYGASRGSRKHRGIDYACAEGSKVCSVSNGFVTKIGYPYNPNDEVKGHLRYVQVTDHNGYDARYFYCTTTLQIGELVNKGDVIGTTQGLLDIYPGITDHFHFEVKKNGQYCNPHHYLEDN